MKAVLLIDLPEGYETEDLLIDYCLHTKGEYRSIRKSGNNPLKPLPTRPDAIPIKEEKAYVYGWNDCLKEIKGD